MPRHDDPHAGLLADLDRLAAESARANRVAAAERAVLDAVPAALDALDADTRASLQSIPAVAALLDRAADWQQLRR